MKFPKAIHPLFLLALGLHAGLLLIPIAGSSDDVIPAPDSEIETISVTRIPPAEPSERVATTSQLTSQSASLSTPVRQPANQVTATRVGQAQVSRSGASPSTAQTGQSRRTNSANPTGSTQTGRTQQSSVISSANRSNLPDLSSQPNPGNSSETASNPAATPAAPQAPLTLAALASKATLDLPDTLTRLADWFNQVYTYNSDQTSEQEAIAARQQWLTSLSERSDLDTLEPQALGKSLQVTYPLEKSLRYERDFMNCLSEKPHQASIGVFVDAAGNIQPEPRLLRSTGYEFLNQEAIERVKDYADFPVARDQKAYIVEVEIAYDSETCLRLANLQ
jgi:hypothetical protein